MASNDHESMGLANTVGYNPLELYDGDDDDGGTGSSDIQKQKQKQPIPLTHFDTTTNNCPTFSS